MTISRGKCKIYDTILLFPSEQKQRRKNCFRNPWKEYSLAYCEMSLWEPCIQKNQAVARSVVYIARVSERRRTANRSRPKKKKEDKKESIVLCWMQSNSCKCSPTNNSQQLHYLSLSLSACLSAFASI